MGHEPCLSKGGNRTSSIYLSVPFSLLPDHFTWPDESPIFMNTHETILYKDFFDQVHERTAVLLQDTQPNVIMDQVELLAFSVNLCAGFRAHKRLIIPFPGRHRSKWQLDDLSATPPPTNGELLLCTSGSSGEPKRVSKLPSQLEKEIEALEQCWGVRCENSLTLRSVSHQHIYGLLFSIIWPLSHGRCVWLDRWDDLNGLPDMVRKKSIILISCPAHLSRWQPETWHSGLVFSSGTALPREHSQTLTQILKEAPIEVYGSTESGGIAWRQQGVHEGWTPLPGVSLDDDGKSDSPRVFSPWLSEQGLLLQDRIETLCSNRFALLGRQDRILKVFARRISLDEMEARLHEHPDIAECRIIVTQEDHEERPAAVIVLNKSGLQSALQQRRHELTQIWRKSLLPYFPPETCPRRFRYLDHLPRNEQGKCSDVSLTALFESSPATTPVLLGQFEHGAQLEYILDIPPSLVFLKGHFPETPVVAGVVQLKWVEYFATAWLKRCLRVKSLDHIKFHHLLTPGTIFSLELRYLKHKLNYRLVRGDKVFSSGTWTLHV